MVCECCQTQPCVGCNTVDVIGDDVYYFNPKVDPCRGFTFEDSVVPCLNTQVANTDFPFGYQLAEDFPSFPSGYEDCQCMRTTHECITHDFANGTDSNGDCCTVARFTRSLYEYAYYYSTEECVWKLGAQRESYDTQTFGDQLAVGGCNAEYPALRQCQVPCEEEYPADICCPNNEFP